MGDEEWTIWLDKRENSARTFEAIEGCKNDSPRDAARIASISFCEETSFNKYPIAPARKPSKTISSSSKVVRIITFDSDLPFKGSNIRNYEISYVPDIDGVITSFLHVKSI